MSWWSHQYPNFPLWCRHAPAWLVQVLAGLSMSRSTSPSMRLWTCLSMDWWTRFLNWFDHDPINMFEHGPINWFKHGSIILFEDGLFKFSKDESINWFEYESIILFVHGSSNWIEHEWVEGFEHASRSVRMVTLFGLIARACIWPKYQKTHPTFPEFGSGMVKLSTVFRPGATSSTVTVVKIWSKKSRQIKKFHVAGKYYLFTQTVMRISNKKPMQENPYSKETQSDNHENLKQEANTDHEIQQTREILIHHELKILW